MSGEEAVGNIFFKMGENKHGLLPCGHYFLVLSFNQTRKFAGRDEVHYYDMLDLNTGKRYDNWGMSKTFCEKNNWELK